MRKKILLGVQGTGNGHLARARHLIPYLQKDYDLDVLVSGSDFDIDLPISKIIRRKGIGYFFGKKGKINRLKSFRKLNMNRFVMDVARLPAEDYNLIITDFEPITAWAAKLKNIPALGIGHQYAFDTPQHTKTCRN